MKLTLNQYKGSHNNASIRVKIYRKNIKRDQHPQKNLWETDNELFKKIVNNE